MCPKWPGYASWQETRVSGETCPYPFVIRLGLRVVTLATSSCPCWFPRSLLALLLLMCVRAWVGGCVMGVTSPGCPRFLIQSIVCKKAVGWVPQAIMQLRKSGLAGVTG